MNCNYLLEYTDYLSYKNKQKELILKHKFQDAIVDEYTLDESTLDNVLESLDTYSFLSEKKIILVKQIEQLENENKTLNHFFKYLENPDPNKLLILSTKELDNRKKITKELKKRVEYIKIENNPLEIIKNELKEFTIDNKSINLLLEYTNNKIDRIKSECDKLKLFKEKEKKITIEDIKSLCFKDSIDTNNLAFDLIKYIASKNKKEAILTYRKLHENNTEDLGIMALLESQIRLLKQVNSLIAKNEKKDSIATILKTHPFRISKTIELLKDINNSDIDSLIRNLAKLDLEIKSGIIEDKKPLEMLILNL
ncbi:MAG: DNA polymerase III subunit delta [Bacilli bacterium]|nr:DNA polymerase III subunit delta [Bacilli bacterium]